MDCCDWLWFIESLNEEDFIGSPQHKEFFCENHTTRQISRPKRSRTTLITRLRRGLAVLRARRQVRVPESMISLIRFRESSQEACQQRPAA